MGFFRFAYSICSALLCAMIFSHAAAYDVLDPYGNIVIKWDVISWTPDGYVAVVTINNLQMFRSIMSPGWRLGWSWAKKEVIWSMVGAQATDQGYCSQFQENIPHCCSRNPIVVDLLPGAPYNQQIAGCCKGGVLSSLGQDPGAAVSAFQLSVGLSGNSDATVRLPKDFTLMGPGPGYTCSQATVEAPSLSVTDDGRRKTYSLMTWSVKCTYSQLVASATPTCCVSFSAFYSDSIIPCPSCACGCRNENICSISNSKVEMDTSIEDAKLMVKCTAHMCPIRVHWHVKANYKEYWRVKIAITNFNYRVNYTHWTLLLQHPNLNHVAQVYSFVYKPLIPYESINDTGMLYGIRYYNDILPEAGPDGNVQSEMIFQKDMEVFTLRQGWAFPRRVYFNGDECMIPPPDSYPFLPNSAYVNTISYSTVSLYVLLMPLLIS